MSPTAIIPITAADTAEQLRSNLAALDLALDSEQVARLEDAGGFTLGEPHVHNADSENLMGLDNLVRPSAPMA